MLKKLIIGVDIRDLKIAQTGTKTYLEELCKAFRQLEDETITFYFLDTTIPIYKGENKFRKLVEHISYQLWKQLLLPLKAFSKGCDILFCTDNFVPYIHLGYKTVPVFHDAFFFEDKAHFNALWLKIFYFLGVPAAKRSAKIITPTIYAKDRIIYFTKINSDKIIPVYEGPKTFSSPDKEIVDEVLKRLNIEAKKYLLHVGVMDKRKNIPALIHAFKLVKATADNSLKLVLVGNAVSKKHSNDFFQIQQAIKTCSLENDIIFTGYLSNKELTAVYSKALMYVFPSLNEGFGIPILESFYFKIPVIVADNSSLPEVGGNAVMTFNPFSISDIADKIITMKNDEQLRKEFIENGTKRLMAFSWERTAMQLIDIFKDIKPK